MCHFVIPAAHSTTLPPSNGQSSSCAHPCEPVKVSNSSQSYRESRERELRAPIPPLDASYAQSEMPEGADRSNSSYNSQEGAQDINHGATSQAVQNGTHGTSNCSLGCHKSCGCNSGFLYLWQQGSLLGHFFELVE